MIAENMLSWKHDSDFVLDRVIRCFPLLSCLYYALYVLNSPDLLFSLDGPEMLAVS